MTIILISGVLVLFVVAIAIFMCIAPMDSELADENYTEGSFNGYPKDFDYKEYEDL